MHEVGAAAGVKGHASAQLTEAASHAYLLRVCRLKESQSVPHTGLVIVEAGLLSGFRLPPGAAAPGKRIRKVEARPEKVILYLDSVSV